MKRIIANFSARATAITAGATLAVNRATGATGSFCSAVLSPRKFVAAALAAAMVANVGVVPAQAADNRTLSLYNTHTKERLTVTFKKNGRFDDNALRQLNVFLRDWRRNEPTKMDPRLFDTVWEVYRQSGATQPIHVVSAYRSLATNDMLRSRSNAVAKRSQHTAGKAMDFYIPGVKVSTLRNAALRLQRGGIGYYPGANNPFVHIDVGSVRHWPRMTDKQLLAVFPDGKTVHVPSSGKPLAGYQQALAELKIDAPYSAPLASRSGEKKRPRGILAMLFDSGEDDEAEVLAASGADVEEAAPARRQPEVRSAPAKAAPPPAPVVVTAPPARAAPPPPAVAPEPPPVVTSPSLLARAPLPPRAPENRPAPVTSLAEATLPADAAIPGRFAPPPAEPVAVAAAVPPPAPRGKPAELVALAAAAAKAEQAKVELAKAEAAKAEQARIEIAKAEAAAAEAEAIMKAETDVPAGIAAPVVAALTITPRPRPAGAVAPEAPVQVAAATPPATPQLRPGIGANDPREDARLALAAFTGEPAEPAASTALGYAAVPASLPAPRPLLASRPAEKRVPRPAVAALPPAAPATTTIAADPFAVLTQSFRFDGGSVSLFSPMTLARQADDETLVHPDQHSLAALLQNPVTGLRDGFGSKPYGEMRATAFSGEAIARLRGWRVAAGTAAPATEVASR